MKGLGPTLNLTAAVGRYLELSKSESEGSVKRRGPRRISRLRLTCGLPVGRDSSLQSKQLRTLHGKTYLPPQSTLQASDSLRVTETENQTQPISTELTFKPQPLIEHSVFAQAFQPASPALTPALRVITDGAAGILRCRRLLTSIPSYTRQRIHLDATVSIRPTLSPAACARPPSDTTLKEELGLSGSSKKPSES
ncbi:unnamed protein product [Rangifer tarandus platyrhynchus]|uniref:Uncharacterized protein n=2 Tax=Rangifer tarandus platyrhynchus TaxID=3082113 RepID=A0ABN8ZGH5_RANTA|nr:unnamed protein product [Rangifer tarandus platyrhynchus]CAI9707696.1 unnamed protein product [Rangifer tarandus platyrhynchus]